MEEFSTREHKKRFNTTETFTVPLPSLKSIDNINIKTKKTNEAPKEKIIDKAIKLHLDGNIPGAIKYYQYCLNEDLNDHRVFSNYSLIMRDYGKLNEAEFFQREALKLKPNSENYHNNLGSILKGLGKLKEAELSIQKAIELNPNFANAYYNLGNLFKDTGKLIEAESLTRKAIELNPDFANAHNNLGIILMDLGNFKEAELFIRNALKLKPDYIKAYLTLSSCLYILKDIKAALDNIEFAQKLEPGNIDILLLLFIIKGQSINRDQDKEIKLITDNLFYMQKELKPIILNKSVSKDLIKSLYKIKSRQAISGDKYQPVIVGNSKGSDFNLFKDEDNYISQTKDYISLILRETFKSDIFIKDSFVTIFKSGGGVKKHGHITKLDRLLRLENKKFSLVYYISVGDQDCKDPGILKLYNPDLNILPKDGMIIIFPSGWLHSAFYSGTKDRIILGVNFYINCIK